MNINNSTLEQKNMIMIGAAGRNVGKTEFACTLIKKAKSAGDVIALKVTTIKEKNGDCPRGGEGCGVCTSLEGNFSITVEANKKSDKDTSRMLAAGAAKVYWLRVLKEHLTEGIDAFLKMIPAGTPVVCESNSLRLVLKPGIFVVIREKGSDKVKESCRNVIDMTDKFLIFNGNGFENPIDGFFFNNGKWIVKKNASAIILAGGKSSRMGRDKSMMPVNGKPMIEHISDILKNHFQDILIGTNDPDKYSFLELKTIMDQMPDQGPLMGILSCLEESPNDLNFITACDQPNINPEFIDMMLEQAADYDAVIPVSLNGKNEPLFAIYKKSITPVIKNLLKNEKRRISALFEIINVKYINFDSQAWYKNINTIEDYKNYRSTNSDNISRSL